MSRGWATVLAAGATTVALKALGPVLLGGRARPLPPGVQSTLDRLPPALFAALIVTQVFASGATLALDARAAGLAAAVAATAARVPPVLVLAAAALATAIARHFS